VGRIHIPDRRPFRRSPGRRVIANLRTQEVSSVACDSYDGRMAVDHVLRGQRKYIIKLFSICYGKLLSVVSSITHMKIIIIIIFYFITFYQQQ